MLGDLAWQGRAAVKPRFEDAFVDMLGGGPPGTSALAAAYAAIPPTPTDR